jgi:Valyl-tRNA synthetase
LANESFINKAPINVVDNEKKKLNEMNEEFELIKTNLDMLK